MFNFQDIKHSELRSYFKNEYKNDWEFEYAHFLDERRRSRESLWSKLKSIFSTEKMNASRTSIASNPTV